MVFTKKSKCDEFNGIHNKALQIPIGCIQETNTQQLHNEINVLPISTHLKLHATQLNPLVDYSEYTCVS